LPSTAALADNQTQGAPFRMPASLIVVALPALIAAKYCRQICAVRRHRMGQHRIEDEKALRKQDRRQTSATDGTDRPDWSTPVFRYTSKVSRQVLRFFKHCFHKPAFQALYEAQLRPLLLAYL
jgi:hypothetical protein